jgi:integrase
VPPRATGPAISQDQRWALTARLLHDTALDPTDRAAGCLLLLYGQPLSRIAAMTTSQVTRRDDQVSIRLGRHDAPVPAPLAGAVLTLINDGRSYRGVGSPPATTWLFPGHLPGRPITPARLGERLRALGIYAQTGRRAALLDLAGQLPAAVLADLLGLHETTAAKWMHQAGGDWSRYAAELARRPHQT